MKILLLVAALAVCACATSLGKSNKHSSPTSSFSLHLSPAPLLAEDSTSRVPGEYVVIFDESVTDDDGKVAMHVLVSNTALASYIVAKPLAI